MFVRIKKAGQIKDDHDLSFRIKKQIEMQEKQIKSLKERFKIEERSTIKIIFTKNEENLINPKKRMNFTIEKY